MKLKLSLARPSGGLRDVEIAADAGTTVAELAQVMIDRDPAGAVARRLLAEAQAEVVAEASVGAPPTRRALASTGSTGTGSVDTDAAVAPHTLKVLFPGESVATTLAPTALVAEARLASGATVELVPVEDEPADLGPVLAVLRVVGGPDLGKEFLLRSRSSIIGRDVRADIFLADTLVSKIHARVEVSETVDIVDLNSANGLIVDNVEVTRISLESGQSVLVGGTLLRAEITAAAPVPTGPRREGTVSYNRSPRVEQRYPGTKFEAPEIPRQIEPSPFPWVSLAAPLLMGVAFLFLPNMGPSRFIFIALSPLILVGTFISQKMIAKNKMKLAVQKFDDQLAHLQKSLTEEIEPERAVRLSEAPAVEELLAAATTLGPGLWSRRPEHWSFLNIRLGIGEGDSRNEVKGAFSSNGLPEFIDRFDEGVAPFATISGVPLVENMFEAGAIGVAGRPDIAVEATNSLLVQIAGLYSPAEVAFAALVSPGVAERFDWLKWLPHTGAAQSPLPGLHLADNAASGAVLLAGLEEVISQRAGGGKGKPRGPQSDDDSVMRWGARVGEKKDGFDNAPLPALVVLISYDAPVDRARLTQVLEKAAEAGIVPIWLGDSVASLPAVCRTFLDVGQDSHSGSTSGSASGSTGGSDNGSASGTVGYVRIGRLINNVEVSRLTRDDALDFARSIAGVVDAGAAEDDNSDLPSSVSFASLLGPDLFGSADAVLERWRENDSLHDRTPGAPLRTRRAGKLRAIVGQGTIDAMHLDLRTQGPHALVGGTTGSGKSEFLQAWVLGMAAEYSPDRVTFLFVDYKGGSAFADCVVLPHCVGLVTDLSPHLVRRALTSLRAELHFREHLFNRKKAKDLIELEKRGDPEAPPALVIVIDEFAALAKEVPEFVDGVVDIAQRGRSLGIHLIMATQRPAGVIKDNLRANTNLRIALRMADESDSQDVVGDKIAASFAPGLPGRAIAKTGPGRLTTFQSAYAGGWTSDERVPPVISINDLRFGPGRPWEDAAERTPEPPADQGPTDQKRLVSSLVAAARAARVVEPRRPWLDELAPLFDVTKVYQRTDSELALGVIDVPEAQRQDVAYFRPDTDGHLAVFGTGGAGKTQTLRTLASVAGITPRGGPVDVYALDFAGNGLRMLQAMPHVGSVIPGDDQERVVRLLKWLKEELIVRGEAYAKVNAGTIVEYRTLANKPDESRILLLIDGFPAFRNDFETSGATSAWYGVVQDLISEGRQLGIHVAITADRPGSVPTAISSGIQRRVVLRLADEQAYSMLDVAKDILSSDSPAGRAIIDGHEAQIAVLGGVANVVDQAKETAILGEAIAKTGRRPALAINSLPDQIDPATLPESINGEPVFGVSDDSLAAIPFDAAGPFLVGGPPGSGRSNTLRWILASARRAVPATTAYYFGNARSTLGLEPGWDSAARTVEEVTELAKKLTAELPTAPESPKIIIVIEGLSEFLSGPADSALVDMIKAAKRTGHFLVGESETSTWSSSWPLLAEIKSARTGFLLQPEAMEGDMILRTAFPRIQRADFPAGRGMFVAKGKVVRVQTPLLPALPS
ncbi:MAG: hypothetical protein JWQ43_2347 [Glaciihabitans sp.]|nr:hypothetical protein [Glaciihabitans sp.]